MAEKKHFKLQFMLPVRCCRVLKNYRVSYLKYGLQDGLQIMAVCIIFLKSR